MRCGVCQELAGDVLVGVADTELRSRHTIGHTVPVLEHEMSREQIALEVHFEGCAEIGLTPERIGFLYEEDVEGEHGSPGEQRIRREAGPPCAWMRTSRDGTPSAS